MRWPLPMLDEAFLALPCSFFALSLDLHSHSPYPIKYSYGTLATCAANEPSRRTRQSLMATQPQSHAWQSLGQSRA